MGKKSKRRGGTGGKKSAAGGTFARDQPAVSVVGGTGGTLTDTPENLVRRARALLQVPKPDSLKGIVSTNDPSKCILCSTGMLIRNYILSPCCGVIVCRDCGETRACSAPDMLGEYRCIFCNAREVDRDRICHNEAGSGKPWAQVSIGKEVISDFPGLAFHWFEKAAGQGNPLAFIRLADLFRKRNTNFILDLKLSEELAKKAYSMSPGFALTANRTLCLIAHEYTLRGQFDEMKGVLMKVVNETDPRATDSRLNMEAAKMLLRSDSHCLASGLFQRAFSQGRMEAAEPLFRIYAGSSKTHRKYALSNLWLYVTCKLRDAIGHAKFNDELLSNRSAWELARDTVRAELRELRNSCGGCGAALKGDRRNMCRACRTYCYCSRECQKRHWNRSKDGHRTECLLVQEHCKMISNTIRYEEIKV